ncbi:DUF342 domain-containing protein [candidate division KSB1 bacterium]
MDESKRYIIRKTEDEMESYLTVDYMTEGDEPSLDEALKALKDGKIVYGIDEDTLHQIFEKKLYNQEFKIAKGTPKIDGIDAKIEFHFDPDKKIAPDEDEKGNVDYKNVNIIKNVKKGDKLAEIIPPVEGKDGMTVTGRKLIAYQGKLTRLPSGSNTMPDPENSELLIANTSGNVFLSKGLVYVESVYEVKGDVNYSTGNIEFVGSVVIKGDVKSGFSVKADGDVEIWGVVEDTTVESKGNVLLKNGITGRGQGKIISERNVYLKFCENQNIIAKNDVIVGEELMHSNVQCEGKVIVSGKKGLIIGGKTVATLGLEAKTIGNYQHAKTEIIVGIKEELRQRIASIEENLKKNDLNADNVKKAIYNLVKVKIDIGELPPDKKALLEKLQNLQKILPQQKENLEKEKEKIMLEFAKFADSKIRVYNELYPGVRVSIQNCNKNINEDYKNVTITLKDGEIKID